MKYKNIVCTGGSGMLGKSLQKIIPDAIYLSSKDYNLKFGTEVYEMYSKLKPDCIIHASAIVGGIMDNINRPATYFTDNVLMNTLVVEYARVHKVERFFGILSTCIYPDVVENYPMTEEILHQGPPTKTNFSYGYSKRCLAVQIEAVNKQNGAKYQYLTPSNLYSENDKFGENSHFVASLIKKIHNAKVMGENSITLFGTGQPLRQFMHSDDLAIIIKRCIDEDVYDSFNVANTENLSIREIAEIALESCNAENLEIKFDNSKPDGQYRKDVSIEKLKNIFPDFEPTNLKEGIKKTYNILKTKWKNEIID